MKWGRSSVGRAPALQAGGQEFESLRLHSVMKVTGKVFQILENRIQIIDQNQKTSKCYIQSESQGYDTNLNEKHLRPRTKNTYTCNAMHEMSTHRRGKSDRLS